MEINYFLSITLLILLPIVVLVLLWRGLRSVHKRRKEGIGKRYWPYVLGFAFVAPYALFSFFGYFIVWSWANTCYMPSIGTVTMSQPKILIFIKAETFVYDGKTFNLCPELPAENPDNQQGSTK